MGWVLLLHTWLVRLANQSTSVKVSERSLPLLKVNEHFSLFFLNYSNVIILTQVMQWPWNNQKRDLLMVISYKQTSYYAAGLSHISSICWQKYNTGNISLALKHVVCWDQCLRWLWILMIKHFTVSFYTLSLKGFCVSIYSELSLTLMMLRALLFGKHRFLEHSRRLRRL